MMSRECCVQNAETCELRATKRVNSPYQAQWLAMAAEWRALAEDETDQATLARLMSIRRTARAETRPESGPGMVPELTSA
jgi:hypothetical protein